MERGRGTQVDLAVQRDPMIEGRLCGCMEEVDSARDAREQGSSSRACRHGSWGSVGRSVVWLRQSKGLGFGEDQELLEHQAREQYVDCVMVT